MEEHPSMGPPVAIQLLIAHLFTEKPCSPKFESMASAVARLDHKGAIFEAAASQLLDMGGGGWAYS